MLDANRIDLAKHRLSTSLDDYIAACNLMNNKQYRAANNRAYYTMFHAIRAVLALEGKDFKKHSAVTSYFIQQYINTGIFNKEFTTIITKVSMIRNESDYDDFFIANKLQTQTQIESVKIFYDAIEEYTNKCCNTDSAEASPD